MPFFLLNPNLLSLEIYYCILFLILIHVLLLLRRLNYLRKGLNFASNKELNRSIKFDYQIKTKGSYIDYVTLFSVDWFGGGEWLHITMRYIGLPIVSLTFPIGGGEITKNLRRSTLSEQSIKSTSVGAYFKKLIFKQSRTLKKS